MAGPARRIISHTFAGSVRSSGGELVDRALLLVVGGTRVQFEHSQVIVRRTVPPAEFRIHDDSVVDEPLPPVGTGRHQPVEVLRGERPLPVVFAFGRAAGMPIEEILLALCACMPDLHVAVAGPGDERPRVFRQPQLRDLAGVGVGYRKPFLPRHRVPELDGLIIAA